MKLKFGLILFSSLLFASAINVQAIEQTICSSKSSCSSRIAWASLGNHVELCGGKCNGKTLPEMNKAGWKLIQVITNLESSFGMLFERTTRKRRR